MSSKARPYIIQGIVAVLVIALGIWVGNMFFSTKVTAKRGARSDTGILVDVVTVHSAEHAVRLESTGVVTASRTMSLRSEVSGRVVWVNPGYYPGSRLRKGDVVARIATEDYEIALNNARIALRQKEAALVLEEAKGRAAEAELKTLKSRILNADLTDGETALIRREPQLQDAIAAVEIARNNVRTAQLNYDRSIVRMPFDGVLEDAPVSVGEYISGNGALGTVVATDVFWVTISLQPSVLRWIGGDRASLEKVEASVEYSMGGRTVMRKARVLSMLGSVESLGRMVQLVLAVDDPFGEPEDSPLLAGTFVRAYLTPPSKISAVEIPRSYLREGSQVYVCTAENRLDVRTVESEYRTMDHVYVTSGLSEGDRVVTTLISSPISGRKLRVSGETRETGSVSEDVGGPGRGGPPPM